MSDPLLGLTSILHSKRRHIFYIEKCRIMVKHDRVVYLTKEDSAQLYWNIPIANTTVIILGTGTSITQASFRLLSSAGVLVGFCGEGGTPLYAGVEIEWINGQNEYRPTKYVQGWLSFWFNDASRLIVAKSLQLSRIDFIDKNWKKEPYKSSGIHVGKIDKIMLDFDSAIESAPSVTHLLAAEAVFTRGLYHYVSTLLKVKFSRDHSGTDLANSFLNHGNYLAYGLAATCLWTLGIPHGFAVMHGKTRRGALVFDVADLIKDGIVLPLAFICAAKGNTEQEFREKCIECFLESGALDYMFKIIKAQALRETF